MKPVMLPQGWWLGPGVYTLDIKPVMCPQFLWLGPFCLDPRHETCKVAAGSLVQHFLVALTVTLPILRPSHGYTRQPPVSSPQTLNL